MTINIEQDLANILSKLDSKLEKLDEKLEQKLDKLDEKLEHRFDKIDQRFDKIEERLNKLEVGQANIKGDLKALDTKTDQLEKRVGNQEFAIRGVLIGLVVVILGGFAMFFWMASKL